MYGIIEIILLNFGLEELNNRLTTKPSLKNAKSKRHVLDLYYGKYVYIIYILLK